MLTIWPWRARKGVALRVYFGHPATAATIYPASAGGTMNTCVSKDGAQMVTASNAPVHITAEDTTVQNRGRWYIDLTATEMDADVVLLASSCSTSNTLSITIIIYTIADELAAAPTIATTIEQKIQAIFQYFFLKRTCTASAETLYKSDSSTANGTNTLSDDGTTVTKGKIS